MIALLHRIRNRLKNRNGPKYPGLSIDAQSQVLGTGTFTYGERCNIAGGCTLNLNGLLELGSDVFILKGSEFDAREIRIGNQTSIQKNSTILGRVEIGAYNVLGPNLYVSSGIHQFRLMPGMNIRDQDEEQLRLGIPGKKVCIGEDCWFGINVVVMPGVIVGKGCVVGANSVVTHDIPPYCVVAGAPARMISKRLAFEPPPSITPCDKHVPYFYQGFKTRAIERSETGIMLSRPEFLVSVNLHGASRLNLIANGVGSILSGEKTFNVVNGIAKIPVDDLAREEFLIRLSCSESEWQHAKIGRIWAE
jgi:acetyltransferase-like isoleucine patch superfamily enzyme